MKNKDRPTIANIRPTAGAVDPRHKGEDDVPRRIPNTTTLRFNAAKLLQTDLNAWMECDWQACGEMLVCLGGPRGTCARTGGWPLCTAEGKARMREVPPGSCWPRQTEHKTEAPTERFNRRQQEAALEIEELAMRAKIKGLIADIKARDEEWER